MIQESHLPELPTLIARGTISGWVSKHVLYHYITSVNCPVLSEPAERLAGSTSGVVSHRIRPKHVSLSLSSLALAWDGLVPLLVPLNPVYVHVCENSWEVSRSSWMLLPFIQWFSVILML